MNRAALGVAAWMRYVTGIDESNRPIDVRDPLAERLRAIADTAQRNPLQLAGGMLMVREVFGEDLPRSETFRRCLVQHLTSLYELGAVRTAHNMAAN